MEKIISVILVLMLSIVLVPTVNSDETFLPFADIYVDDNADPGWYDATHVATIQEGVDNQTAGGDVYVYNGTYYEYVTVNKFVNLIGQDKTGVILNGSGGLALHFITGSDESSISTFNIQSSDGGGITVDSGVNNITICNNIINVLILSMVIYPSQYHQIYGNTMNGLLGNYMDYSSIHDNYITASYGAGIDLVNGIGNTFEHNEIYYITDNSGIVLEGGDWVTDNYIANNTIHHFVQTYHHGIKIDGNVYNNTFYNNTIYDGQGYGVLCTNSGNSNEFINNTIYDFNDDAIMLENGCGSFNFMGNTLHDVSIGLAFFHGSNGNIISQNEIYDCSYAGIRISAGESNEIYENIIYNCSHGSFHRGAIWFQENGDSNTIYRNNFYNNDINTEDEAGTNTWYASPNPEYTGGSSYLGNYYDDYTGVDGDGDGVGDTTYYHYVSGDDPYPLIVNFPFGVDFDYEASMNVTFNATSYSYMGNSIVNYTWDLGDGNYSYISDFYHVYTEDDYYNVTLTVEDSGGNISSVTKTISVFMDRVHNLNTDEWFANIQTAIDDDDTLDGHTIFILNGFSYSDQSIAVSKELTIQGESRAGVDLTNCDISIQKSNTTVANLTIHDLSDAGIWVTDQNARINVVISGNEIYNALRGIHFDMFEQSNAYSCHIYDNIIHDITSWAGVWVLRTNNVTIENNTIYNCTDYSVNGKGIWVEGRPDEDPTWTCKDIIIQNNDIYDCRADAIQIVQAENVLVDSNDIYKNFLSCEDGIDIRENNNQVTISNNDISGCGWATWVWLGDTNININHNYYHDNYGYAFLGTGSDGVIFEYNTLYNNKRGIGLDNWGENPTNYQIRYNNIVNTGEPGFRGTAFDLAHENIESPTNVWEYNYWSDYTGIDENNDGIGDTDYSIGPNAYVDTYDETPLYGVYPFGASFEYSFPELYSLEITLVSTSYDYDGGGITNYTWDLGDGTFAYTREVVHEYSGVGGLYTITLTVQNATTTASISYDIFVSNPPYVMYVDTGFNPGTPGWRRTHWDNIQDAVYYIPEGGTVYVWSGTYYESIYIYNKSINLIGSGAETTIIDSMDERYMDYWGLDMGGSTFQINGVHDSEISGFTFQNAGSGRNRATFSLIDFSEENPNEGGRQLLGQPMNLDIHDNIMRDAGSHNVLIAYLRDSDFHNNTVYDATYGIGLWNDGASSNARIYNNTVYNISSFGILSYTGSRQIYNNHVYSCYDGISVYNTNSGSEVYENYVHDCTRGIYSNSGSGSNAYIYRNNLSDNTQYNAYMLGGANWMGGCPRIGNYYSNYAGADANGDGIGDDAYQTKDARPLVYEYNGVDPVRAPVYNVDKDTCACSVQDAIDDADMWDTLELSWYDYMNQGTETFGKENLVVDKSINIVGTNKDLIVIDGQGATPITVTANDVFISNLTITGSNLVEVPGTIFLSSESFEGSFEPTDWTQVVHSGTGAWEQKQYGTYHGTEYEPQGDGSYYAWASSDAYQTDYFDVGLFTPYMDLSGCTSVAVDVNICLYSFYSDEFGEIRTYSDGILEETLYSGGGSESFIDRSNKVLTFDPSGYSNSSNVSVEFYYTTGSNVYGWFFSIDDVSVYELITTHSAGIDVDADDVRITKCNITGNDYGIWTHSSVFCSYNNFWSNTQNANDAGDSGYRYNWWDTYDEPSDGAWDNDTDGIADDPYPIPGGSSQDVYPLMTPWSGTMPPTYPLWDVNQDGIVNYLDVSALVSHYREHGPPGWIPEDINDDGIVNYLDISSLVSHYGESY